MPESPERAAAWEAEGRRLSPALDGVAAALVTGPDVVAASHLALGLASGQSARRRVALGDLTGMAEPLHQLVAAQVTDEDPHGLADVFLYGASPNRVARQVDDEGRLFVLPAGTEPLDPDRLADDRWARIAGGFRDVGALLLLVAPTSTPQLDALARRLDGTVAADDGATTQLMPNVLATAQRIDVETPAPALRPTRAHTPAVANVETPTSPLRRLPPAALVALALLAIAVLVWAGLRVGRGGDAAPEAREAGGLSSAADSTGAAASRSPLAATAGADSAAAVAPDSLAPRTGNALGAAGTGPVAATPPVANPADTVRAAAFAIELFSADAEAEARDRYRTRPRTLLAATVAPVASPDGMLSYRVAGGAYRTRALAERELGRLRALRAIGPDEGALVRLPYAVQIESGVSRDSLRVVMNRFVAMRLAPYAMEQPNRSSSIYVGAFAEPSEARALLSTLQAANVPAALVVRTGKPL